MKLKVTLPLSLSNPLLGYAIVWLGMDNAGLFLVMAPDEQLPFAGKRLENAVLIRTYANDILRGEILSGGCVPLADCRVYLDGSGEFSVSGDPLDRAMPCPGHTNGSIMNLEIEEPGPKGDKNGIKTHSRR